MRQESRLYLSSQWFDPWDKFKEVINIEYIDHTFSLFLELMLTDPTMQELKLVLDNTKNQDLAKKYSLSIGGIYE